MLGIFYIMDMGVYYSGAFIIEGFPFRIALLACFIGVMLIELYRRRLAKRCGFETEIEIEFRGKKKLHAIIDTANTLVEPISGLPVAVVGLGQIKDIFTPEQISIMAGDNCVSGVSEFQCRAVPFKTINGEGIMLSFLPKQARILKGNEWRNTSFYVGVSDKGARGAEVLLPVAVFENMCG
jgi:hypothetical protein